MLGPFLSCELKFTLGGTWSNDCPAPGFYDQQHLQNQTLSGETMVITFRVRDSSPLCCLHVIKAL